MWLCSNKISFAKAGSRPDLSCRPCFTDPSSRRTINIKKSFTALFSASSQPLLIFLWELKSYPPTSYPSLSVSLLSVLYLPVFQNECSVSSSTLLAIDFLPSFPSLLLPPCYFPLTKWASRYLLLIMMVLTILIGDIMKIINYFTFISQTLAK